MQSLVMEARSQVVRSYPLRQRRGVQPLCATRLPLLTPLRHAKPGGLQRLNAPLGGNVGQQQQRSRSVALQTRASRGSSNVIETAIRQELGLESTRLPDDVRERVETAIQRNRYKATAGEVAAQAGVTLTQAEEALKALAYDSQAVLQVSGDGDVVYCFQPGFQSTIRNKSISLRAKPVLSKVQSFLLQAVRVTFGSALIASIVITFLAITIVLSSRQSSDNRNDSRSSGGSGGGYMGFRMGMLPFDIWLNWAPRRVSNDGYQQEMSFPESIFSFVFGDGDPNLRHDEERWRALGQLIQRQDGVVTAEEMAPFLEPKPQQIAASSSGGGSDEAYVLPALLKFGGEPFVDEQGQLLYKFPSLQKSVRQREDVRPARLRRAAEAPPPEAAYEQPWEMTSATVPQQIGIVALGVLNVVGVATLSSLMSDPPTRAMVLREGFGWISAVLPFLGTYAGAFFGIPAFRWVRNTVLNWGIEQRNAARELAARQLARPGPALARKIEAAREQGQRKVITASDIVFTTEQEAGPQGNVRELDEFDRRLADSSRGSMGLPARGAVKQAAKKEVVEETLGW